LAEALTLKVLLVPELDRLKTPAAPVLVLEKPYRLPRTEALEVSAEFLFNLLLTLVALA
jgi:hypothetical protein